MDFRRTAGTVFAPDGPVTTVFRSDGPQIGLGTAGVSDSDLIAAALNAGYRFVDTAKRYGNEAAVGKAL